MRREKELKTRKVIQFWILCVAVFLSVFASACEPAKIKVENPSATWSDNRAQFKLEVQQGSLFSPFVATLTISNKTGEPLRFPTPYVMPLAWETSKNNIRVYNSEGQALAISGPHSDFTKRPKTAVLPYSSKSWTFKLEDHFPRISYPGAYSVELWYYCNNGPDWTGHVDMARIDVERKMPLLIPALEILGIVLLSLIYIAAVSLTLCLAFRYSRNVGRRRDKGKDLSTPAASAATSD